MNMNFGFNANVNQTFQRVLTQACFKCQGDGQVYPFEQKRGIPSMCPACQGNKVIDGSYSRCFICSGEGLTYPFEGRRGIPSQCTSCGGNGYQPCQLDMCFACNGEGKVYPFDGRRGIPSECTKCFGKGGQPLDKKYLVTTNTNFNNNYVPNNQNNYNQNYNYNQNSNWNQNNDYNQNLNQNNNYNQNWNQNNNYNQNTNYNQNNNYNQNTNYNQNNNYNQNTNYNQNWNQPNNYNYNQSTPMIQTSYEPVNTKLSLVHNHPLFKGSRSFNCDLCSMSYTSAASNHCKTCDFDICDSCSNRIIYKNPYNDVHYHSLQTMLSKSNWSCNTCGSKHINGGLSWRCSPCNFDVCVYCMFQ